MAILNLNCDSIDTPYTYHYPTFAISESFCKSNPFYKYWNGPDIWEDNIDHIDTNDYAKDKELKPQFQNI